MGHFSNGTEGLCYQDHYCDVCVNDRNQDCAVWLAHLLYNDDKSKRQILELFIPRNGCYNEKCKMFKPSDTSAKQISLVDQLKENKDGE